MAEEVRPCSECGSWVETRAIECRHCGAKLEDVDARRRREAEAAAAAALAAHTEQEGRTHRVGPHPRQRCARDPAGLQLNSSRPCLGSGWPCGAPR